MLASLLTLALTMLTPTAEPRRGALADADAAAARALTQRYADAWLANDPEAVMATLTSDAVLLPSGMKPVIGHAAIRRFWFPSSGPRTRVTAMALAVDEVRGDSAIAFVRGTGTLTYVLAYPDGREETATQASWFLNVVERQPDGRWLIARRLWSDLRPPA